MQAKQTIYKGHNFRSRTEARWAVFFDTMGIAYEYEQQDFMLPSGRYLPDFYLPGYEDGKGIYVEVKGEFTEHEKQKCKELCELSGVGVLMLNGAPDFKAYDYFHFSTSKNEDNCPLKCVPPANWEDTVYQCKNIPCIAPVKTSVQLLDGIISSTATKYGNRMFVFPGFTTFEPEDWYDGYKTAVFAARSARFEFGESGSTL